jgi:hypothetical protein
MDTPGAEDGRVDEIGLGRLLYRLRLSTRHVRAPHRCQQQFTHAVQHPSNPIDQMMPYQIVPIKERPNCKT